MSNEASAGTVASSSEVVLIPLANMSSWEMEVSSDPVGVTPRILVPVTTISARLVSGAAAAASLAAGAANVCRHANANAGSRSVLHRIA